MTSHLKGFYAYWATTPPRVNARHVNGRPASQVKMAFLAPSTAAALRLTERFGWGRSYIKDHVQVHEPDDLPSSVPLDQFEPGTILIAPLNPGDTIDGTTGWRPYTKP